jgi:hypothetical protein
MHASEEQAEQAIAILERAITAARNGNQAGENAVVKAAAALSLLPRRRPEHSVRKIPRIAGQIR